MTSEKLNVLLMKNVCGNKMSAATELMQINVILHLCTINYAYFLDTQAFNI